MPLDESISPGQLGHIADSQTVHAWVNNFETAYLANAAPPAVGAAGVTGVSTRAARQDHVHADVRPEIDVTKSPYNADKTGGTSAQTAIATALTDAHNASLYPQGAIVRLPAGTYQTTAVLNVTKENVSVLGVGAARTTIAPTHNGDCLKLLISALNVNYRAPHGGFTILGNAGAAAVGMHIVNWIGSWFYDIAIKNFSGANGIGMHLENTIVSGTTYWTERNNLDGIHLADNKIGLKLSGPTPTTNSFGYNRIRVLLSVQAGQTGILMDNGVWYYGSHLDFIANVNGANTATISLSNGSQLVQGSTHRMLAEQMSPPGGGHVDGVGIKLDATSYIYSDGPIRFENGLLHSIPAASFTGHLRVPSNVAVDSSGHLAVQDAGTIANFGGSGQTASIIPLLWDRAHAPQSFYAVAYGSGVTSPIITMYEGAGNRITFGRTTASAIPSAYTDAGYIDWLGRFILPLVTGGFLLKEGVNASMGVVTLVAGAATVANTRTAATSRIFLTRQAASGTLGHLSIGTRVAGTSFIIQSSSATEVSNIGWLLIDPAP